MSHAQAHVHAEEFDAHGHKDHGHVIVSIWTLRFVLAALMFFTLVTVGAALAEEWVAETFNVIIPQWANVAVALSIATVKTTLVVLFFMQLKYDNPLNSMIFIFTIITVAFFLGFTTLDVGNRATIDRFKSGYVYDGGNTQMGGPMVDGTDGESITERAERIAKSSTDMSHGHGHGDEGEAEDSSALRPRTAFTQAGYRRALPAVGSNEERSRPVQGITLPGLAPAAPAHDEHATPAPHAAEPAPAAPGH